ncbi:MAG: acyltransferase [Armatimonadota bacterium]
MKKRMWHLDTFRGIAVFLVLGAHWVPKPGHGPFFVYQLQKVWKMSAWVAVDMFFVLSGFLVSGLLFNEYKKNGNVRLKRFFIRRAFKIYPVFYIFVLATVLVHYMLHLDGSLPFRWSAVLCETLFVQNYGAQLWWHTWSLGVEEHFYILLGLYVYWRARRSAANTDIFGAIRWIYAVVAVACILMRVQRIMALPYDPKIHSMPTHLRMDALMFGVWFSYYYYFHRQATLDVVHRYRYIIVVCGLALLSTSAIFPVHVPFMYSVGHTLVYLGFGGVLIYFVCELAECPKFLTAVVGPLAYIGTCSYPIYIWHASLLAWWLPKIGRFYGIGGYWQSFFIYVIGSVVWGIVVARLVEIPMLSIRDTLFPSLSTSLFGAKTK